MINFLIGAAIALIAIGIGTAHAIIAQWRLRSELNYERFAQVYAEAATMRHEARQAGDRA